MLITLLNFDKLASSEEKELTKIRFFFKQRFIIKVPTLKWYEAIVQNSKNMAYHRDYDNLERIFMGHFEIVATINKQQGF